MKIKIIKDKNARPSLVEEIAKKIYPNAEIEAKLTFKPFELKEGFVVDASKFTWLSARETALKLVEITGCGISNKVLENL